MSNDKDSSEELASKEDSEFMQNTNIESNEKIGHSGNSEDLEELSGHSEDIVLENIDNDATESSTNVKRLSLFDSLNDETAPEKIEVLKSAGTIISESPAELGTTMIEALKG